MERDVTPNSVAALHVSVIALASHDWQELKALRLEALQREPAAFGTTYAQAVAWPDDAWQAHLANPRCKTFMARADGAPIGMAGACRGDDDDERVGVVVSMYVNERYRRRGVGKMLLAAAIAFLRGIPEIATIRLWVNRTHLPARGLYEAMGFRLTEGADGDLLVMERMMGRG